jgi:hypothetical protein
LVDIGQQQTSSVPRPNWRRVMNADPWSDELLNGMRMRGDPIADGTIADLVGSGATNAVNELMRTLVFNEQLPPAGLPEGIRRYLDETDDLPFLDPEQVRLGQEVFELYGSEVLMALGLYSTPAAYAARRGAQVLHRTAYFENRTMSRIWETTQFVVDVLTRGGLAAGGMGVRTAQKVRLMHAAIRHQLVSDPARPWDFADLGVPINQEDMAGTLMEFSCVVLEGLDRMGIALAPRQKEAVFQTWRAVGRIIGVTEELIPDNLDDARVLTRKIAQRQIAESLEGRQLTAALVAGMQTTMPPPLHGFIPSAMRFFLENDPFTGKDVAAILAVPPADWTERLVAFAGGLADIAGGIAGHHQLAAQALRAFKVHYVNRLLVSERGPGRPSFRIPAYLQDLWKETPATPTPRA